MQQTLAIIAAAAAKGQAVVMLSGGTDSTVLLDVLMTRAPAAHRPTHGVYVNNEMDPPETQAHVEALAARYDLALHVAVPKRTFRVQWSKYGWPGPGKLQARKWTAQHKGPGWPRLDNSTCCDTQKIRPGRKASRALGAAVQYVGSRGDAEASIRGKHDAQQGTTRYLKRDNLYVACPLSGWTDTMVHRYVRQRQLPEHPARARGLTTVGCVACLGGSQFDSSAIRQLRRADPAAWRRWVVAERLGRVILSIRYEQPLPVVDAALVRLGGLEAVAAERPWVFDFTRETPLAGNRK